jgi:hypothetical protein
MEIVGTLPSGTGLPLGYQQIAAIQSNAVATLTVPAGALSAIVEVEAQAVRYRDDGTAPTATVGVPIAAGARIAFYGFLGALQFIAQVNGAILNVSYYK